MRTQSIGRTGMETTRLSYGCMRIAGTWNPQEVDDAKIESGKGAVLAAYDAGYRLFDHADIYCAGKCEYIFGQVLKDRPEIRSDVIIATKCGIRFHGDPSPTSPHRYDFSYDHIISSCDRSLENLGVETIDIYQLHRPDLLMDPAEVARAFHTLFHEGKVRHFGVSNFSPSFVRALQAHLPFSLVVNQVEIHLGRLDPFYDGTLDQCLELDITPLSWSPLGGGWLGDGGDGGTDAQKAWLLSVIDGIARSYGVSRTVISLAWLLKHPSKIIPIVGSVRPDRIQDAATATQVDLDREDWYRILVAARAAGLP